MEYIYKYKDGQYNGQYFWDEYIEEANENIFDIDYVFPDICNNFHTCIKSALYDDMTGYKDKLQDGELNLDCDELYVVTYFKYDNHYNCLEQCVDLGVTKEEIADNVLNGKYQEGAEYCTLGKVMKATKDWIESGKPIEH